MIEDYILYIWLGIFIISFIVEAFTVDLVSIWFAFAALITLVLSAIPGIPWWVEVIVFFVLALGFILSVRPLAKKYLQRNESKSNIDEIIGKKGKIIKKIDSLDVGEVRIGDVIWSAISSDENDTLEVDTIVEVVAVQGNKLVVKRK